MTEYIRVRWVGLKPIRESTIAARRFEKEKHAKLDKPALDERGNPLPPKFGVLEKKASAASAAAKADKRGPQATDNEEKD